MPVRRTICLIEKPSLFKVRMQASRVPFGKALRLSLIHISHTMQRTKSMFANGLDVLGACVALSLIHI